ncbi:MAG: glycosyltransferase family 4 protein [Armatimonadota bacterium]|nr:glycosyltransferase family 4 protein [Armatimonadota bacterium]
MKKKVAIIHGAYLHRRHAGALEPLKEWYDLIGVATRRCALENTQMGFEVRRLLGVSDIIRRIPKLRHRIGWGTDQYLFGFDKALSDIDIFYPGSPTCLFSWQAARLKKKTGARLVLSEVENIPFLDADRWIWKYRRETLDAADAIITATERARSSLIVEGVDPGKITHIPLGVDTKAFSPERKDAEVLKLLGVEPGEKVVLFAGRLIWGKGVFELAYAAKRIIDDPDLRGTRAKFVFLGAGSGEAVLRRRIADMGIGDRVLLKGFIPYEKTPAFYASVDIAVAPSIPTPEWVEQVNSMVVECMSSGAAMVVAMSGGLPDVTGDAALLVAPADHLSLYEAIKDLLLDDAKRKDFGRRARRRALDTLDMNLVARQTADVFESIS